MEKNEVKILVVEDDVVLNTIYQTKLNALGYPVSVAHDGEEGLMLMKKDRPHIVLLDLMLPKKNGFEVLAEAKQDQDIRGIPIIILSNLGQESDIRRGMELGAADFLIKSNVKLDEIINKIDVVLQKHYK